MADLIKGKTTFATAFEAEAYCDVRINSLELFDNLNTDPEVLDDRTQTALNALQTATKILDRLNWSGTSTPVGDYKLSWPRNISYYEPRIGSDNILIDDRTDSSEGTIPEDIKEATIELALHLLKNAKTIESQGSGADPVGKLSVGSINLDFKTKMGQRNIFSVPSNVYSIIEKYLNESNLVQVNGGA